MDDDNPVGYAVDTFRIVKDQSTIGTIAMCLDNTGDFALIITPQLDEPISITFSGNENTLTTGDEMSVTAETSEAVDLYAWYLNGLRLTGETASIITLGSNLDEGDYTLTCLVLKGNVVCSESLSFSISNDTDNSIIANYYPNSKIVVKSDIEADFDTAGILADSTLLAVEDKGNIYWDKVIQEPADWGV